MSVTIRNSTLAQEQHSIGQLQTVHLPQGLGEQAVLPESSASLPDIQSHPNPYGAVAGKIRIIEGLKPRHSEGLMSYFESLSNSSATGSKEVLVSRLDKLPVDAPTVAGVLRQLGIPETRIRQLLLQVGLQNLIDASPKDLSASQLRILAIVAALRGPESVVVLSQPFRGLSPQASRALSDFLVVTALERKKAFVVLEPGKIAREWKGNDWAVDDHMNFNIPQEFLELQMARDANKASRELIETTLRENLLAKIPLLRFNTKKEAGSNPSLRTEQIGGPGIFILPGTPEGGSQTPQGYSIKGPFFGGTFLGKTTAWWIGCILVAMLTYSIWDFIRS